MRVAFLADGPTSRGATVARADRLRRDHGIDARVVRVEDHGRWDVAVATSWEDALVLYELDAARYAFLVASMEERLYGPGDAARGAASATHDLPLSYVAETRWIAQQLGRAHYVRRGVDKATFTAGGPPGPRGSDSLRILVVGNPTAPHDAVADAVAAVGAMSERRTLTLALASGAVGFDARADRVVVPRSPQERAAVYREHDVVLRLARVDGMPVPPLEGFHCGATCVVTPVTGHDEYVVDGWNGLVVGWDDERGVSRTLDLLARDLRLLHLLRANALATARAWPSERESCASLALALRRIATTPSEDPEGEGAQRAAAIRSALERSRASVPPPSSSPPPRQSRLRRRALAAMRRTTAGRR